VKSEQSSEVELGLLEQLDLSDVDVLQRVDVLSGLLNLSANNLGDELGGELSKSHVGSLSDNNVGHLLSDLVDLRGLGVGGLLDLVGLSLGETDDEESEEVVVGGLDGDVSLNQSLPLSDERSQLVGSEVKAVEVGEQVLALDLVNSQLDLLEGVVLLALQISKGHLEHSALEVVVGESQTGGSVHEGLADVSVLKGGGSLDVVPVLLGEGVDNSLLDTLLSPALVLEVGGWKLVVGLKSMSTSSELSSRHHSTSTLCPHLSTSTPIESILVMPAVILT
jgi:hypothetical protein